MAEAEKAAAAQVSTTAADQFEALLAKEFKPKTDRARAEVEGAVRTLAEQALRETTVVSDDVIGTIKAIIAEIDKKLSDQMNAILHNEKFQQLESAWRGLDYLVSNTETDEMLKIRVMNISKKDLAKTLKKYKGVAWDQSPIFKRLYEQEYGQLGGEPYGCLVGDYYFDHAPGDVELLGQMSQVAAAAHAPFLSRVPYGARTSPVEEFDFEEETGVGDQSKYTWTNAAYAMAVNVNRSFKQYGWCTSIRGVESGGAVEGLPVHTFPSDDGGVDMTCPTEIAISDRREMELANSGLMPLIHRKNTDVAAFIGAQSLQKPTEYTDPDATSNARIAARLPYLFASCRFAHYLKCMVRDKVGSFMEREDMQRYLHNWIQGYVLGDPSSAGESWRARKPLAAAEVKVEEIEGNPGFYAATFHLRPHYQLEGVNVSMRLVSKLPSQKK